MPVKPRRYFLICDVCEYLIWDNEAVKLHPEKYFECWKDDFGKWVGIQKRAFKCPRCKNDAHSSIHVNRLNLTEVANTRDGRSFLQLIQSAVTVPVSTADFIKIASALIRSDRDRHPKEMVTRTFKEVKYLEILLRDYKRGSGPIKNLNRDLVIQKVIEGFGCKGD
jgi:hypothetical protein